MAPWRAIHLREFYWIGAESETGAAALDRAVNWTIHCFEAKVRVLIKSERQVSQFDVRPIFEVLPEICTFHARSSKRVQNAP
jgi:hypothetical protein